MEHLPIFDIDALKFHYKMRILMTKGNIFGHNFIFISMKTRARKLFSAKIINSRL
jgi:hypothetical protein